MESSFALFSKYSHNDINFADKTLADYIKLTAVPVPHSGQNYTKKRFMRAHCPIVERLTNFLMRHGRNSGKKTLAVRLLETAFDLVHAISGRNPLQVLVTAIENSSPREGTTRVGARGIARMQSVDVSPFRRVNLALRNITKGARKSAFKSSKSFPECLADELLAAAGNDAQRSFGVKQKVAEERLAKPNR